MWLIKLIGGLIALILLTVMKDHDQVASELLGGMQGFIQKCLDNFPN